MCIRDRLLLAAESFLVRIERLLDRRLTCSRLVRRHHILEDDRHAEIPAPILSGVISRPRAAHGQEAPALYLLQQHRQMILLEQFDEFLGVSPFCRVVILNGVRLTENSL